MPLEAISSCCVLFHCKCMHAKLLQSSLTLCDPMDCSPPGSSVHGILQARTLEWDAMASSRGIFPTQGLKLHLLHLLHGQAGSSSVIEMLWKGVISSVSRATIQGKVFGNVTVHPSVRFRKVKAAQLCLTLCDPMDCSPRNSPGQNTGVGSLSLLQGVFPTQGLNPGLETKS